MRLKPLHAAVLAAFLLAGCGGRFASDYDRPIEPDVSSNWRVTDVHAITYESRTVNEDNVLVPTADIVWHGEPEGDRRAQAAVIVAEGVRQAAAPLRGGRPVELHIAVDRFHAVTPVAVNYAPAAVHDIEFRIAVVDRKTRQVLVDPVKIDVSLLAYTQSNAVLSRLDGRTERQRIVEEVAKVAAGWLGTGPDARRSFVSLGY